jgi:hypothetical protein
LQFLGDLLGVFGHSWARFAPYKEGNQKNNYPGHFETVLWGENVGIRNAQIPLMLKLREDRRTKILLLLKLGIKVCRIITESYRHLILYKRR